MRRNFRLFVNYQQEDWSEKLETTEIAAYHKESVSTKLFSFSATESLDLRMNFDIIDLSNICTGERIIKQNALNISENMEISRDFACKAMVVAQESQFKRADKNWKNISYIVGDSVWLSTKYISKNERSKKLDDEMLCPIKVIGNEKIPIKLHFPQSIKILNVFHPNLLQNRW